MEESGDIQGNEIAIEHQELGESHEGQNPAGSLSNSSTTNPDTYEHHAQDKIPPAIPPTPNTTAPTNPSLTYECPDLDELIFLQRNLLLSFPTGNPERAKWLASLGVLFQQRFERLGKPLDIGQAVNYHTQAVSHTSDAQPEKHSRLSNLSSSIVQRYLCQPTPGKLKDLERAVNCQTCALNVMPPGHYQKPNHLCFLGQLLLHCFNLSNKRADLDSAISHQREAVSLAPDDHEDMPAFLVALSSSLACRSDHVGEPEDLDQAISSMDEALLFTPDHDKQKPQRLKTLGNLLKKRYERQNDNADSNRALRVEMQALLLTSQGTEATTGWLSELGHSMLHQFEQSGDLSDLEQAMSYQSRVLSLAPREHDDRSRYLENMASSLRQRFQRLGELTDVDNAIAYQQEAIALTGEEHTSRPRLLSALGDLLRRRFERVGNLLDIDQAIERQTYALSLTPFGHADMPGRLDSRGNSFLQRFLWLGEYKDLDSAIDSQEQAVFLAPENHARRPDWLSDLGKSYQCRFENFGALKDIDKAILCQIQAVRSTPPGHIDAPSRLEGLGNSRRCRFEKMASLTDIERAIADQSEAVSITPQGHPDMPRILGSLSNSHVHRFHYLTELEDINKAIEYQSQAVMLLPETHADKSRQLFDLGHAFIFRHDWIKQTINLDNAFIGFDNVLILQQEVIERPRDLTHGIMALRQAAAAAVGSPSIRFKSARAWAKIAWLYGDASALEAYGVAMSLLPRVIWLGSPMKHREQSLSLASDIAVEAAAVAIESQRYELAIEWLEEGSSILWRQVLELRTPLDELHQVDAELASKLKTVARMLEQASLDHHGPTLSNMAYLDQVSQRRRRLAEEWEQTIQAVRQIPQFKEFLQPKKARELIRAAHSSAVVILNVHVTRCDALVILPGGESVAHLPLPNFSHEKAVEMRSLLVRFLSSTGITRRPYFHWHGEDDENNNHFATSMKVLWECVVQPVLRYLGYLRICPIGELPHITWRTTGPLASFPMHAAGCFDTSGSRSKIYNYAISSYTPTLAALLTEPSSPHDFRGILAVGQEATPGLPELPAIVHELENISRRFGPRPQMHLMGSLATREAVLSAMETHSWVHLACHAHQDSKSPMHSAFHLHDGHLDINSIGRKSLKHAGLAFLSACQTATGDEKLPEEAVHLASGMIVAGYPTVIATLWSIEDTQAPIIADRVYGSMLAEGVPDIRRAARALHQAVGHLRDRVGEMDFSRWAPYIHVGI